MPSSQSVSRAITGLTRSRPRLAVGAGAALASVIGVAAASTGPAVALAAARIPALPSATAISPAPRGARVAAARRPSAGSARAASPQVAAAPAEQRAVAPATSSSTGAGASIKPDVAPSRSAAVPAQPTAAPAQPAASPTPQPQPAPQPYWIYDSVNPSALPSYSQAVAVYANGNFAASPSQVGRRGLVLWIDTNGSDPRADVLDVEPGDATPTQAATWVAEKLDASPNSVAIVYTMKSDWPAVQAAINALPWWMPSHTRYWIADPTGFPHIVPGSQATQWYWGQNYDISTALPNF